MAHPGIFAIIVGVAIGTAIYYYLNSESPQQQRYTTDNSSNSNYYRASPSTCSDYPSISRKRRRRNSNDKCVICFDTIPVNDVRKLDSCGHEFHYNCITKWLKEKKDCPICRTAVI